MAISRTTKIIGGREVSICRCSASEALDLELTIARVAGNVDVTAIVAAAGGDWVKALTTGITEVVSSVAKNLTHAELVRLMNLLFKFVTLDGKQFRDINEDFSDRPRDIWDVFIEAVKFNLGPLGEGLLASSKSTEATKINQ